MVKDGAARERLVVLRPLHHHIMIGFIPWLAPRLTTPWCDDAMVLPLEVTMAKTGCAVAKLVEKGKRNAIAKRLGTFRAVITRTNSTHHEKVVAYEAHRRLIRDHFINPCPPVTYDAKGKHIVTFRGDGLPDDSLGAVKAPKTMAERAEADDRKPLKSEWKAGWRPGKFGRVYR